MSARFLSPPPQRNSGSWGTEEGGSLLKFFHSSVHHYSFLSRITAACSHSLCSVWRCVLWALPGLWVWPSFPSPLAASWQMSCFSFLMERRYMFRRSMWPHLSGTLWESEEVVWWWVSDMCLYKCCLVSRLWHSVGGLSLLDTSSLHYGHFPLGKHWINTLNNVLIKM